MGLILVSKPVVCFGGESHREVLNPSSNETRMNDQEVAISSGSKDIEILLGWLFSLKIELEKENKGGLTR